jgi:ABC-type transport system involved in multi-copper enzyme maturation permease subunit
MLTVTAGLDPAAAWTLYLGVVLAGAMFLSLGLFISSLVRDQLVAALIALAVGLPFIAAAFFKPDLDRGGFIDQLIYFFSVPLHFSKTFTRGLLDTRPLVLYVTMTALFLFLTVRSLESRRWR